MLLKYLIKKYKLIVSNGRLNSSGLAPCVKLLWLRIETVINGSEINAYWKSRKSDTNLKEKYKKTENEITSKKNIPKNEVFETK